MRKTLHLTLIAIAFVACASSDMPEPYDEPARRPPRDFGAARRVASSELALPSAWWHDPGIAEPLKLTADQFQRLEALRDEQDEVDRLEHDGTTALRDLRTAIEAKDATPAEIIAAGKRLRDMRDALLDRQIALIASQREILTQDQWQQLKELLAEEWRGRREDSRGRGMGGRPGGRGGFGGRRPGGVW